MCIYLTIFSWLAQKVFQNFLAARSVADACLQSLGDGKCAC